MLTIKRAKMEDAEEITKIKTVAFNKEINTYYGEIESMHEFEFAEFFNVIDLD